MRIALVTEYYYPTIGGVQEHVFHLARELRGLGHSATVVTSRVAGAPPGPAEEDEGVVRLGWSLPVESNGSVGRVTVGPVLGVSLARLLRPDRFDLVHVHSPLSPVLGMLAARRTALPLVGTHHTNFTGSRLMSVFRGTVQEVFDRMDVHLAVSGACVKALSRYVRGSYRIVPNGVDCRRFAQGRRIASWPRGRPLVLFIGRLEERSGLDRLLRAWPAVLRDSAADLVVVGDGPGRARYEAQARELGLDVRFTGALRRERVDWLATADLLVAPTTIASFGITLLEAMAAGVPVVASDIDGFREVLCDGREGLLVDTADAPALARAVAGLLRDPDRRRALGEAGRRTVRRYDWPQVAREVVESYEEALDVSRRAVLPIRDAVRHARRALRAVDGP